jgi:hypothetical protein
VTILVPPKNQPNASGRRLRRRHLSRPDRKKLNQAGKLAMRSQRTRRRAKKLWKRHLRRVALERKATIVVALHWRPNEVKGDLALQVFRPGTHMTYDVGAYKDRKWMAAFVSHDGPGAYRIAVDFGKAALLKLRREGKFKSSGPQVVVYDARTSSMRQMLFSNGRSGSGNGSVWLAGTFVANGPQLYWKARNKIFVEAVPLEWQHPCAIEGGTTDTNGEEWYTCDSSGYSSSGSSDSSDDDEFPWVCEVLHTGGACGWPPASAMYNQQHHTHSSSSSSSDLYSSLPSPAYSSTSSSTYSTMDSFGPSYAPSQAPPQQQQQQQQQYAPSAPQSSTSYYPGSQQPPYH